MATQSVAGKAPITFTDSQGAQRSVPLSALELNGSGIELAPKWAAAAIFSAQDTAILLALANTKLLSGELTPPPALPPRPAITFAATLPGSGGNNIQVSVTPDTNPLPSSMLLITASETDTYAGLGNAADAASQIGVDAATGKPGDPPAGTGLVMVQSGSAVSSTDLPKDKQNLKVNGPTPVLATDNTTTLFVLVPRADYTGPGIGVKVTLDQGGTTFTLTASYDAANTAKIPATQISPQPPLNPLPPSVAFLVTAQAPPSGLAAPPEGTTPVSLSGGAPGIAATGVVYTSY